MQLFSDNSFFISLALLSIPAFILGVCEKQIKYYGAAASAVFIWLSMGKDIPALCWMLGFTIYEYIVIQLHLKFTNRAAASAGRESKAVYRLFLVMSIMPLAVYKVLAETGNPYNILGFAGISYMTFKAAQIVIESYDGIIKEVRPFDYTYLMLFFPPLTSGPIDRSRRFNEDLERKIPREEYLDLAMDGIYRILLGMVYKIALSALMYQVMIRMGNGHSLKAILIYMYAYGAYLYFDFAGYSLMAVGAGYLFGIRVPDNFNKPFIARDISDFWNRWHITLSHWLRDYVFSRITMELVRSRKIKNKLTIAGIAFMTNMFIMGCWHGLSLRYIVYGLYHGALLTCFEVLRKKSKWYKKHKNDRAVIFAMWFLNLHLVLLGFLIFSGKLF